MAEWGKRQRRLSDGYSFGGFRARATVRGVFGDPNVRILRLDRRSKKRFAVVADGSRRAGTTGGGDRVATCRGQDFGLFWDSKCGASQAAAAAPGSGNGRAFLRAIPTSPKKPFVVLWPPPA